MQWLLCEHLCFAVNPQRIRLYLETVWPSSLQHLFMSESCLREGSFQSEVDWRGHCWFSLTTHDTTGWAFSLSFISLMIHRGYGSGDIKNVSGAVNHFVTLQPESKTTYSWKNPWEVFTFEIMQETHLFIIRFFCIKAKWMKTSALFLIKSWKQRWRTRC